MPVTIPKPIRTFCLVLTDISESEIASAVLVTTVSDTDAGKKDCIMLSKVRPVPKDRLKGSPTASVPAVIARTDCSSNVKSSPVGGKGSLPLKSILRNTSLCSVNSCPFIKRVGF